jgi:hypothetical protein
MSKLQEFLDSQSISNRLINLKDTNSLDSITEYLSRNGLAGGAVLFDGLDEVKGSLFPSILEKLEEVSRTAPDVAMYISSRSVFSIYESVCNEFFRLPCDHNFAFHARTG